MGDPQVPGLGPVSIARSSQARRQDNSISFHWATNQPSGTTASRHARNPGSIPPTGDTSVTRPNTQPDPAVASGSLPDLSGFDPGSHSPVQQSVSTFLASLGVGTHVYHLATGFSIPLSRLPLDPEISGPTPFSSPQIPPSRGRVGRHTDTQIHLGVPPPRSGVAPVGTPEVGTPHENPMFLQKILVSLST